MNDRAARSTDTKAWLLTLVQGMPQMIWRAVNRGFWTWSSPQWNRYTGQSQAQSAGFGWLDVVHPDDRESALSGWEQAEVLGEFHADLRIRGIDGSTKWFQTRGVPLRDEDGAIQEWIGTSTDIDDLRQLESEQKVLVAELQHRTRNLIAVVHSICMQTLQGAASLDDFRDRFENRLSALSRVQGLLSTSEHDPITIRRLIEMELSALADVGVGSQAEISGPETVVRDSTAQTLALAVHELCTNALKYGALSDSAGRLTVNWYEHSEDGHPWLCLEWRERGTPGMRAGNPDRQGYGRILIERALPRQLGARTQMSFGSGCMTCLIDVPLKHFRAGDLRG